jgi:hypothetical protein
MYRSMREELVWRIAAAPAYTGPMTWDDSRWRCCRACLVEWTGGTGCFLEPSHSGERGRLRSFCHHGRRRVRGPGNDVCGECETHDPADFTAEFHDAFSLAADRALADLGR